jgi:hypothetical protein
LVRVPVSCGEGDTYQRYMSPFFISVPAGMSGAREPVVHAAA